MQFSARLSIWARQAKQRKRSSGRWDLIFVAGPHQRKKGNRERDRLEHELLSALSVPPFDPRGDFKQGQIIAHPKWGRGKVETVLRGSLLVRFLDGLRQVSRQ